MTDAPSDVDEPAADRADELPTSALDDDRYAHLALEDGAVVIYDRHEPETWLQSDFAVEVGV